jgi:hypothetical protein
MRYNGKWFRTFYKSEYSSLSETQNVLDIIVVCRANIMIIAESGIKPRSLLYLYYLNKRAHENLKNLQ